MKHIRWINRLVGRNWKTMVSFAILIQLFSYAVIFPGFSFLFNRSLQLVGLRYLTAENLSRFLHNPIPFITLGLLALFYAVLQLYEITGFIYIFDQCRHGFRVSVWQVLLFAFRRSMRVFKPRNLFLLLIILFLTPLLHFATLFNLFWSYSISERVVRLVFSNLYLLAAVVIIVLLSVVAFFRWMYICHYFTLDKCTALDSLDRSTYLGKETHSLKRLWPMFQVHHRIIAVRRADLSDPLRSLSRAYSVVYYL